MSGLFVIACVLITLGLITFAFALANRSKTRATRKVDYDGNVTKVEGTPSWIRITRWVGLGVTAVGLAFLAGSFVTSVPAQSVGVAVAFEAKGRKEGLWDWQLGKAA